MITNNPLKTPTTNTDTNTNTRFLFYLSVFFMLLLSIITIVVIYSRGTQKLNLHPQSLASGDIFLIVGACITVGILVFLFFTFPDFFKNIVTSLTNSSYLISLVLYIVFTIILYQNILTPVQIKEYSYFILPLTVLFAGILFFLNIKETIGLGLGRRLAAINQQVNRIKYSITYFCLIVFLSTLYFFDPNHYISQYMGPFFVISILLLVFGFLFLLTLMTSFTLPTADKTKNTKGFFKQSGVNINNMFHSSTIFGVVGFLLFLILVTVGILSFPGGFKNSSPGSQTIIVLLILFSVIFWIISFLLSMFQNEATSPPSAKIVENIWLIKYAQIFQKILLLVFGLTFSGLLVYWLVTNIQSLSTTSGIVSFILNLFIILFILGLIYKIYTTTYPNQKNGNNINTKGVLSTIQGTTGAFLGNITDLFKTDTRDTLYLIVIIIAILCYIVYPYAAEKITDQGGLLLVNQPVYLNQLKNLASYHTLNQTASVNLGDPTNPMQFNYHYAISFWVFFDSTNSSNVDQYTSILNYGEKPNILFNPVKNTLIFTMNTNEDNRTLYEEKNVLLQKWNHIVINYTGSIFDIFINGKLVKSVTGVLPYKTLDMLQIGSDNGIQVGICNINYFNKSITVNQIYYLYHFFKNKTPPTHSSSQDTIINILDRNPDVVSNKPLETSTRSTYLENITKKIETTNSDAKEKNDFDKTYDSNNFLSWDWYFKNNKY